MSIESLYIHWPFCPYKCHFCPFVALAGQDNFMGIYNKALISEIEYFSDNIAKNEKKPIKTIYFGGGTPSTYPKDMLLDTCGILNKEFDLDENCEFTIEVNPGTVNLEKLELWKQVGINRLSIGVQSLDNNVLHKLNRHQYAEDVLSLLDMAPKLFDNISIDLIVGLPDVSDEYWNNMIDQIVKWPIKHISMYFLTIHEDTPLYFGVKQKKIAIPDEESTVDLYLKTVEKFKKSGLIQYEISNFAKEGFRSKHNMGYWNRVGYRGLGLGAYSFQGNIRFQNEKNLMKYINGAQNKKLEPIFYEKLTEDQVYTETVMLGLRQMTSGVSLDLILSKHPLSKQKEILNTIFSLKKQGLISINSNSNENAIAITSKGIPVINEILIKILI